MGFITIDTLDYNKITCFKVDDINYNMFVCVWYGVILLLCYEVVPYIKSFHEYVY